MAINTVINYFDSDNDPIILNVTEKDGFTDLQELEIEISNLDGRFSITTRDDMPFGVDEREAKFKFNDKNGYYLDIRVVVADGKPARGGANPTDFIKKIFDMIVSGDKDFIKAAQGIQQTYFGSSNEPTAHLYFEDFISLAEHLSTCGDNSTISEPPLTDTSHKNIESELQMIW